VIQEVRLNDAEGRSAGNIDFVLVAYDEDEKIIDFGSIEVQAVYISGNVRKPFAEYIKNRRKNQNMVWDNTRVRPDYLSSSRKRLVPQMLSKGSIFQEWHKKQTVVLHRCFFETLPTLPEVSKEESDIAWLIYDLIFVEKENCYQLIPYRKVYTQFRQALQKITTPKAGSLNAFVDELQIKLEEKLENELPPDAPTLSDIINYDG
jgi:hypothetical protein